MGIQTRLHSIGTVETRTVEVVDVLGYIEDHPRFARDFLIKKAIIAPPPNNLKLNNTNVEEGQNTSTSWEIIEEDDHQHCGYEDLTYYKSKFYAIRSYGVVVVVEGIADSLPFTRIIDIRSSFDPEEALFWCKYYLVESSGDLLKVMRMQDSTFKVLKVDFSLFRWEKVLRLDKCAIFFGSNHSFSLSTSDFPGYRGNCIYFTDDGCPISHKGIFNLEDGAIETFQPDIFQMELPRSIWYGMLRNILRS